MSAKYSTLRLETDARGVLTIWLARPDIRNAFNGQMIDELARAFGIDALERKVKAVVLRGEGAVFCAGGDLNWMKQSIELDYEQNLNDTRKLTQMFAVLNECPKPVIGAIHGAAIGGGVGLVSICDIVIAVKTTQFSLSEVRLGIIPACIGPFVIAKIGASHARKFFLSAERFLAEEARDAALVHEVVETEAELAPAIEKILGNVLNCGPQAMAAAKKLVLDLSWPERRAQLPNCLNTVAEVLAKLRISEEGQEGLKAFLEKRKPNWLPK